MTMTIQDLSVTKVVDTHNPDDSYYEVFFYSVLGGGYVVERFRFTQETQKEVEEKAIKRARLLDAGTSHLIRTQIPF